MKGNNILQTQFFSRTLIILLAFVFSFSIACSESDITPPVLHSITVTPTEIHDGDYFTINVNATDDLSGIDYMGIWIRSPTGNEKSIHLDDYEYDFETGLYTAYILMEPFRENGTWTVDYLYIYDVAGNQYTDSPNTPILNVTSSKFYLRCPQRPSSVQSFSNKSISLGISPNNDSIKDSFNIFIPYFTKSINYTLSFIKGGSIVRAFSKTNVNYINETWYGNRTDGSIADEGVYDIKVTISDGTEQELYYLGNLTLDLTSPIISQNFSGTYLAYNESLVEENNITIDLNSSEELWWKIEIEIPALEEIGELELFKTNAAKLYWWFDSYYGLGLEIVGDLKIPYYYWYQDNLSTLFINQEANIDVCQEDDYYEENYDERSSTWQNVYLDENNNTFIIHITGYDDNGNNASFSKNLTFYSPGNSEGICIEGECFYRYKGYDLASNIYVFDVGMEDAVSIPDNTYGNGFNYTLYMSFPENESKIRMSINDWRGLYSNATIKTNNNTIVQYKGVNYKVGSASNYSESDYFTIEDANSEYPGIQTKINVLVKLPADTLSEIYATTFAVKSETL